MRLTLNESEVIAILTALNVRAHNISQIIVNADPKDCTQEYRDGLVERREEICKLYTRVIKLK